MSTPQTRSRDAELEARELLGEFPECPQCHHNTLEKTENWPATLVDPACATGWCACRDSEMVSVCCGYPNNPDIDFCGNCREHTGWERECECTYEF